MAIGKMPGARQEELFVAASAVRALDNPFYAALDRFLRESGFDEFAEETCREFYAERMGRPGLPPGVYFRVDRPRTVARSRHLQEHVAPRVRPQPQGHAA